MDSWVSIWRDEPPGAGNGAPGGARGRVAGGSPGRRRDPVGGSRSSTRVLQGSSGARRRIASGRSEEGPGGTSGDTSGGVSGGGGWQFGGTGRWASMWRRRAAADPAARRSRIRGYPEGSGGAGVLRGVQRACCSASGRGKSGVAIGAGGRRFGRLDPARRAAGTGRRCRLLSGAVRGIGPRGGPGPWRPVMAPVGRRRRAAAGGLPEAGAGAAARGRGVTDRGVRIKGRCDG